MPEVDTTQDARDNLAGVVLARYRRARDYRNTYTLFQGHSVDYIINRTEHQMHREYMTEDRAMMAQAFGFVPSRYYGVALTKVQAGLAWKTDLVLLGLDNLVTVSPTPEPDIDSKTRDRIRNGVRNELLNRMANSGIVDAELLLDGRGRVTDQMKDWLDQQAQSLKKVEQARKVSAATGAAERMQRRMRDVIVEGGFRQAYMHFSQDQLAHGRGVMRFPKYERMPQLVHSGSNMRYEWAVKPRFQHVKINDFYPIDDAPDTTTNTGNTERTWITKSQLIAAAEQDDYFSDQIKKIIEEFAYRSRNWLDPADDDNRAPWWQLDESIPLLVHEGYFSGDEMAEYGITGIDTMEYVSAKVEVCAGRTIRCKVIEMPYAGGRSYYQATFNRTGSGLYDAIGMGAMVWDSEQRINRLMHIFESNVDWAARPPVLKNRQAFNNPNDADEVVPGGEYDVEERFGVSGSMPDALRAMRSVSAQYHLILTQVNSIMQQADDESGLPSYAYTGQNFGRSSLGEYTQRMSNALRAIKMLAVREDMEFIEPAFTALFNQEVRGDPDLRPGQDVNLVIRGMTGLVKEDVVQEKQQQLLPLLLQGGQPGSPIPEEATQYGVYQLLSQAGFPMEALGISDPVIDNALAAAANAPAETGQAVGQQVPSLDGRSGPIPSTNVAQPNGASNLGQSGPVES